MGWTELNYVIFSLKLGSLKLLLLLCASFEESRENCICFGEPFARYVTLSFIKLSNENNKTRVVVGPFCNPYLFFINNSLIIVEMNLMSNFPMFALT